MRKFYLASREKRLAAKFVDAGITLMIYYIFRMILKFTIGESDVIVFKWGLSHIPFLVFMALNYKLLNEKGQTVGKKIFIAFFIITRNNHNVQTTLEHLVQ
ncbi:MAG: RDD family protein [Synergistaceae bacterium]|jgi:hypothetical protein|nr:RDD family protein [Synergistaceae bacterium]